MSKLCLILGDQLSLTLSSLTKINKNQDQVMLCEVSEETNYVKHHPKKIALIFSAMRHFSQVLTSKGYRVRYVTLDDKMNAGSFTGEVKRALAEENYSEVIITESGEWRVSEMFRTWKSEFNVPITVCKDDRFLCDIDEFKAWAENKKQLRMEFFYREMRKKHQILLNKDGSPVGGRWNFDAENRKPLKLKIKFPQRMSHQPDTITQQVLELVARQFSSHFGDLHPFDLAVDRDQALAEAHYFIQHYLVHFGDYQDAMLTDEAYLYHSRLSFYLNIGLLLPLEVCQLAEAAYHAGKASINSVEGFIRQILGWREYVRGIYWLCMPDYKEKNTFGANRPLPNMYWGGKTQMFCMQETVRQTKQNAYSHHIQRLMITGNFALLTGLSVEEVCTWYLAVYADAYEWVELPNTLGMALFADNGIMASKPYAASGKYINRMSNFCKSCVYDPKITVGEKACPFNALYWDFIGRNQEVLRKNNRLNYAYTYWDKISSDEKHAITQQVENIFQKMHEDKL